MKRFDFQEIQKVFSSNKINKNHRVWITLIYTFGMSIQELIEIKVSDLNLENKTLRLVSNKKLKPRILKIPMVLLKEFRNRMFGKSTDDYIFDGRRGKLHRRTIFKAIEKVRDTLGIYLSLGTLKNSLICHLYENGWEERDIAKHLGHNSVRPTRKCLSSYAKKTEHIHPIEKILS